MDDGVILGAAIYLHDCFGNVIRIQAEIRKCKYTSRFINILDSYIIFTLFAYGFSVNLTIFSFHTVAAICHQTGVDNNALLFH